MPKLTIKAGATSQLATLFIQDSSKTDGSGLTGLVYNTSGLTAYYFRQGDASSTVINLQLGPPLGTWASAGFSEVDATHMPGVYQLGLPNAVVASLGSVVVYLRGATNMAPCLIEIQCVNYDPTDGTRLGLTAMPNAAAGANGGMPTVNASNQVAVDGTSALTEAYPAKGGALTLATALYATLQNLEEFSISGTTISVRKRDQSSVAETFTLDSATTPTSRTRAT